MSSLEPKAETDNPKAATTGRAATGSAAQSHADAPADYTLDLRDVFYVLGLITLAFAVLYFAAAELIPIVLAILIWFFINAIANALQNIPVVRRLLPRWLALALASVFTLGAMFLAIQIVVSNLEELRDGFVGVETKIADGVAALEAAIGVQFGVDVRSELQGLSITNNWARVLDALFVTTSNITLVLLFVLFLLLDQPFYQAKIRALFPDPHRRAQVQQVLSKIGEDTRLYVLIMTVISAIVGFATYLIADWYGMKGAGFWGFLAFALNFIPTIGTFLGVLMPGLFALVQFDPTTALTFVASLAAVQFVMGNLVLPRVTGDWLNLSEFVVILSLTVWGGLWGVAGWFLAVPMMMVFMIVMGQFQSTRPLAVLLSKTGSVSLDR